MATVCNILPDVVVDVNSTELFKRC